MKKILYLFILSLLLIACSEKEELNIEDSSVITEFDKNHFEFYGEGQYWETIYDYDFTDTEDQYFLTVTYKGDEKELKNINNFSYSFKSTSNEGSGSMQFDENEKEDKKTKFTISGMSKGGTILLKDEIIKFSIIWGENEEEFELKNIQNLEND